MGFGSAKDEEARSKPKEQRVQETRPCATEAQFLPGKTLKWLDRGKGLDLPQVSGKARHGSGIFHIL